MQVKELEALGKKTWTANKWDEYQKSLNTFAIKEAEKAYYEPTDQLFKGKIEKSKWRSAINRKVNYLLGRKPLLAANQELLDDLLPFIKLSARQYLLRGSLIWVVQGDGEAISPRPLIMNNTIAVYGDEYKEEVLAFIRKFIDIEVEPSTGAETEIVYLECFYKENEEQWAKATFNLNDSSKDTEEILAEAPLFIELGKTGDAPLFAYVDALLEAYDNIMRHQDMTVAKNTTPLTEVKGYTGTDDADLRYAVDELSLVKVDGNGGVTLHMRSMDSVAIDMWAKRLMQEFYEATATVGKENELQYAQSGKALDRLFVDMENSAQELAAVLEDALLAYFESIGIENPDIVWNTDRPYDDKEIIEGISASSGLLSEKTLIEQHPWVEDVEEELKRKSAEGIRGFEDLYEEDEDYDEEEMNDGFR